MGALSPSRVLSVLLGGLFLLSAPSAAEGLVWDDATWDLFEILPVRPVGAADGADPAPARDISNRSAGTEAEPAQNRSMLLEAVMESLSKGMGGPEITEDGEGRSRGSNFSFVLPRGWKAAPRGDLDGGNLTLEGPSALATIVWFEDSGIDPEILLRQVVRAYRSGSLRFSVLEVEPGEAVTIDGQRASTLNVFYIYGGLESQKRIVAWSTPRSGRFFFASFWSVSEAWDANLGAFEALLASFRDEGAEGYVELEPRTATFDLWGAVLQETLRSYHFERVAIPPSPEVGMRVVLTAHREAGRVDQLASEEIVSSTPAAIPPREAALQALLLDRGYAAAILRRGGAFWLVVQGPEGGWQAISSSGAGGRGMGSLVGPDDLEWYRGLVAGWPDAVEGPAPTSGTVLVEDCNPPRIVRLDPRAEVNLTWILGIEELLNRYRYSGKGNDSDSFMKAQVCWALLEREGHDALLVTSYEGHPLHPRMWVIVHHPGSGHVAVDPAASGDRGLGEIVSGAEWFDGLGYETSLQYSCLHPDKGHAIDPEAVRTPDPG